MVLSIAVKWPMKSCLPRFEVVVAVEWYQNSSSFVTKSKVNTKLKNGRLHRVTGGISVQADMDLTPSDSRQYDCITKFPRPKQERDPWSRGPSWTWYIYHWTSVNQAEIGFIYQFSLSSSLFCTTVCLSNYVNLFTAIQTLLGQQVLGI